MKAKPVILVVDDRPQNIELIEAHLVPQGYEIVKAANGEEALGKLSGNKIDLILLDVLMPGMDGFEVTRRIRQDNTHRLLPIILVTSLRETEDRLKGIEAGCDDFLSKPVDKMELLARVRSLLKVKAYNDLMSNYRKELESEVTRRTEELKQALENLQQGITKRKNAEDELRRSEEKYRTILEEMEEGYFELDLAGNFIFVNGAECRNMGYPKEELIGMNNRHYQDETTAQKTYQLFTELYRTGEPVKASDIEIIRKDGTKSFNEISVSLARDAEGKPIGFRGISRDITERKQAEEERKQSFERMRKALRATVQAISITVEMRDPYTSGHQQRVADLARSIATEMGLSADRQDFIRTASTIHDIGKIAIPSEMLSKPTKLTDLEFSLIKTHSQSGYDILKDIEFPWPVADVVLQHHERIDGSGYPQGLKGDDILLEARILAIADVVEAIASHRPYRPALGIDLALEEISGNKGILYDADAVDACLKLFREKGYQLKRS